MIARLHHWVPQFYLKRFCAPSRKLFVVDAVAEAEFTTSPRNVAAERDFNRVEIADHAPDALEAAMAAVETEMDGAIERIVKAKKFHGENDRGLIFNLMRLLAVRNPRHRETLRDFQTRAAKMMLDVALATPARWDSHRWLK